MIKLLILFLVAFFIAPLSPLNAQENAAPSIHLVYWFPTKDAVLKMQKVKITKSADASFFEVNRFTNGYTGLQQTPDKRFQLPNILISSLWDYNTQKGIYSKVAYFHSTTDTSRFGGEGDGYKTIHPYGWKLNQWYNIVNRGWIVDNQLFVATFIRDESSKKWFHSATLSLPATTQKYLERYNNAFLENWDGRNADYDGRFERKAYFKDVWNLTPENKWEKNYKTEFSANNSEHDKRRNGKYHNSFNANYDPKEDAYFMEHGGNVVPDEKFKNLRSWTVPLQQNQGEAPKIETLSLKKLSATFQKEMVQLNWEIDEYKTPQLSVEVKIMDAKNKEVLVAKKYGPEMREYYIARKLGKGKYKVHFIVTDIFNQAIEKTIELKVK